MNDHGLCTNSEPVVRANRGDDVLVECVVGGGGSRNSTMVSRLGLDIARPGSWLMLYGRMSPPPAPPADGSAAGSAQRAFWHRPTGDAA